MAGHGATPGHVAAIWWALLDQASQSRPRGAIAALDVASIAAAFDWDPSLIQAVLDALTERRHIVDGCVRQWRERNPEKQDSTAAERQRRHRAKKAKPASNQAGAAQENNDMSRRDTRDSHNATHVTPLEEKEQKSSFSDSLSQETDSTLKLDTPRSTRALNAGAFWQQVQAMGLQAHIGIRTVNATRLRGWLMAGLTEQQLALAYERAQERRQAARDPRPVNLGFLACLIDQVLAAPAKSPTAGGAYARGDNLSRTFASG